MKRVLKSALDLIGDTQILKLQKPLAGHPRQGLLIHSTRSTEVLAFELLNFTSYLVLVDYPHLSKYVHTLYEDHNQLSSSMLASNRGLSCYELGRKSYVKQ